MTRTVLKYEQWDRTKEMLAGKAFDPGPTAENRVLVDAVLWIIRTEAPWRNFPEEFGHWHNVIAGTRKE